MWDLSTVCAVGWGLGPSYLYLCRFPRNFIHPDDEAILVSNQNVNHQINDEGQKYILLRREYEM